VADFGGGDDPTNLALQPDGKLVLPGESSPSGHLDFTAVRLHADGDVEDATFDYADFDGRNDWVNAAARAPDGKLVVAGESSPLGVNEPVTAVARYSADGSLDETFGSLGKTTLPAGDPRAVLVLPDGKVLLAAKSDAGRSIVTRLTAGGKLDATFGTGGTAAADFDGGEEPLATVGAALRANGEIVLSGTTLDRDAFAVTRLTAGGAFDQGLGAGGRTKIAFDGFTVATAPAVQADGKIVIAGVVVVNGLPRVTVARLLADPPPEPGSGGPGGPQPGGDRDGDGGVSPRNLEPPALSRLRVTPARFALGGGLPRALPARVAARRPQIRFELSERARVRFAFRRVRRGRAVKARGGFAVDATAGANRVRFAGRLTARRRLAPGRYRLIATPVDALGNTGHARRTTFRLLEPGTGRSTAGRSR
jgi:uncharacterized delta-60 repeat protein